MDLKWPNMELNNDLKLSQKLSWKDTKEKDTPRQNATKKTYTKSLLKENIRNCIAEEEKKVKFLPFFFFRAA